MACNVRLLTVLSFQLTECLTLSPTLQLQMFVQGWRNNTIRHCNDPVVHYKSWVFCSATNGPEL